MAKQTTYADSGVDINATDAAKRKMVSAIDSGDPRVYNKLGAFASLLQGSFPGLEDPVLVIKTDEPGSKQKLAIELDRLESLSQDLVNHTVNDVTVMGAEPLYVTDCIICASLEQNVVNRLVDGMASACAAQGCVLIGGETSVQPGVVVDGLFVLSATVVGVADRDSIIDGSAIAEGDVLVGVASNGLHTNGYTLVRRLIDEQPDLRERNTDGEPFLDVIMRPHTAYYPALKQHFADPGLHGMAHITGGGIHDNLIRILPGHLEAHVELDKLRVPTVFRAIREAGSVPDVDMLRTFNLGTGLVCVCDPGVAQDLIADIEESGFDAGLIGEVRGGAGEVVISGTIDW